MLVNIEDKYNKKLTELFEEDDTEGILAISCFMFKNPQVQVNPGKLVELV